MRDATAHEKFALELRTCPDCGGIDFRPGPRGGAAQNIECRGCGARFNVTVYGSQLIFAQRIESEADGGGVWREDMFPR